MIAWFGLILIQRKFSKGPTQNLYFSVLSRVILKIFQFPKHFRSQDKNRFSINRICDTKNQFLDFNNWFKKNWFHWNKQKFSVDIWNVSHIAVLFPWMLKTKIKFKRNINLKKKIFCNILFHLLHSVFLRQSYKHSVIWCT